MSLAVLVPTTGAIGLVYDEPVYLAVAQRNWGWWGQSLRLIGQGRAFAPFSEEVVDRYWHNRGPTPADRDMHPPLVKTLAGISLALFERFSPWVAMRLPGMFLLSLTVALLFLFLSLAVDRQTGLFAALALLTLPRVFGHAHFLALDVPVAAMSFLTTVLFWKLVTTGSWRWTVALGLGFGLTLSTKMNAFLVPLPLIVWAFWRGRREKGNGEADVEDGEGEIENRQGGMEGRRSKMGKRRRGVFGSLGAKIVLAFGVVAPAVWVLTWPWLWYDTGAHLVDYFRYHLRHYPISVTYFGRLYSYAPWHYPFVLTAITVPTAVLLLAGGALLAGGWGLIGARKLKAKRAEKEEHILSLLALSVLFHLLPFALPGAAKYNGIRLFMPAFPFLAGLAGLGFRGLSQGVCRRLEGWSGFRSVANGPTKLTVLLGLFLLLPGMVGIAHTHPYTLSYYNLLIGGLPGAYRRGMEPTYWGETYYGALPFLNAQAPRGALVYVCPRGVVPTLLEPYQRLGLLRSDLRLTGDETRAGEADFIVFHNHDAELNATTRSLLAHAHPAHTLTLDGVPLLVIYDQRRRGHRGPIE